MGHKHSKDEILNAAVEVAREEGLANLSFGRVAKQFGTSDRVVVYYFPSKDDLITEVLSALGLKLQQTLALAFAEPAADHLGLLRKAWPIMSAAEVDAVMALFFEASGLAAAGQEPYRSVVATLMEAWIAWAATLVEGSPTKRRSEAEAAVAVLDGLLLMRHVVSPEAAARAARRLFLA
jgi:AcrR family transcriptional regulator